MPNLPAIPPQVVQGQVLSSSTTPTTDWGANLRAGLNALSTLHPGADGLAKGLSNYKKAAPKDNPRLLDFSTEGSLVDYPVNPNLNITQFMR